MASARRRSKITRRIFSWRNSRGSAPRGSHHSSLHFIPGGFGPLFLHLASRQDRQARQGEGQNHRNSAILAISARDTNSLNKIGLSPSSPSTPRRRTEYRNFAFLALSARGIGSLNRRLPTSKAPRTPEEGRIAPKKPLDSAAKKRIMAAAAARRCGCAVCLTDGTYTKG